MIDVPRYEGLGSWNCLIRTNGRKHPTQNILTGLYLQCTLFFKVHCFMIRGDIMQEDNPNPSDVIQTAQLRQQHKIIRMQISYWLFFGILWLFASVANLLLANAHYSYLTLIPWLLFSGFMFFQPYLIPSAKGRAGLTSSREIQSIWNFCIAGIWISGLLLPASKILPGQFEIPLVLWWISIGTYATGVLSKSPNLRYVGFLWFLGGTAAFYLTIKEQWILLIGVGVMSSMSAVLMLSRKLQAL
ncbi:hypothetical protein DLNHIDIE_00541 [Acidithiobacillus thiooxidans ATCC 19377]|nr:hypothetical protein [Acidithiobacillus marinus]TQN50686.1 hypothetical protein DLNHIDIE_00541 [Acidithiobacillus thiooxidans ATCC 19377]